MTLEKFHYLTMLCEERNVTKAAQRLFITQPTLTTFVNNLERNLGFKIFDRSRNPIQLTSSGKLYMERIKKIIMEESQLIDDIRSLEHNKKSLTIGIGQIHSEMWCPQLVQELLEKCPGLNVVIRESQEQRLMEYLRNDEIDVILGHLEIDTVNFHFEVLCEENLALVIPENLMPPELLADAQNNGLDSCTQTEPFLIRPEVLADLPMIQPVQTQGLFLNLKQLMETYHIHPIQTIQTSNMLTAASMVELGLGYMYLSPVLFRLTSTQNARKLYYCTLPRLAQTRKYYIGYKENHPNMETILQTKTILKNLLAAG